MGLAIACTLPLPDGIPGTISSFVGRTCSVAADSGCDDIANMSDVSNDQIKVMTEGEYHHEIITRNIGPIEQTATFWWT